MCGQPDPLTTTRLASTFASPKKRQTRTNKPAPLLHRAIAPVHHHPLPRLERCLKPALHRRATATHVVLADPHPPTARHKARRKGTLAAAGQAHQQ